MAEDPRTIPHPYPTSIAEAQRRQLDVLVTCSGCRVVVVQSGKWLDEMIARHGDLALEDLARRARCQRCGHRGAMVRARIPYGLAVAFGRS